MKSLIIGGAGFVGAYLISCLKNEFGQDVAVTKMPMETIQIEGKDEIEIVDLDILDPDAIVSVLQQIQLSH